MPLESGEHRLTRPWGKADAREEQNLSGAESLGHRRQRGRNRKRFLACAPSPERLETIVTISRSSAEHHLPRFVDRHIGPDAAAVATMLEVIGVDSLEELAAKALPAGILDVLTGAGLAPGLDELPGPVSEDHALAELRGDGRLQHGRGVDDRSGLLRHADAGGAAPQHT